ncbi:MAG: hypothetical protein LBQ66_02960, partial [Planctomycetaceae bacterium]|nr:hypothetical protein [Planctomycetaceae bacterium]
IFNIQRPERAISDRDGLLILNRNPPHRTPPRCGGLEYVALSGRWILEKRNPPRCGGLGYVALSGRSVT